MSADYDLNGQIAIETDVSVPLDRLRSAITYVLEAHDVAAGTGLSFVITDDDTIRQMNRQFRAVDAPTDVLSFPADPSPMPGDMKIKGEDEEPYLGDLVLSLPYIQRQAAAEGHTLSDEITLAVIHGTLHLLGYDHDSAENQALMWAVQADMLSGLGVAIVVPEFEFDDEDEGG
jgi:probable rRNA maturation factor